MKRVGRSEDALTDQSLNANLAFSLLSKGRVTQDLEHQSWPLGSREEVLLVVTGEEHVNLVEPEGGGVVVRDGGGEGHVHHVG